MLIAWAICAELESHGFLCLEPGSNAPLKPRDAGNDHHDLFDLLIVSPDNVSRPSWPIDGLVAAGPVVMQYHRYLCYLRFKLSEERPCITLDLVGAGYHIISLDEPDSIPKLLACLEKANARADDYNMVLSVLDGHEQ